MPTRLVLGLWLGIVSVALIILAYCTAPTASAQAPAPELAIADCWDHGEATLLTHAQTASAFWFGESYRYLLPAMAYIESTWRPLAINPTSGAAGLMQIMPRWHDATFPATWSYFDACNSLAYAGWYLDWLLRYNDPRYPEGLPGALTRYSGGSPNYAAYVLGTMERMAIEYAPPRG